MVFTQKAQRFIEANGEGDHRWWRVLAVLAAMVVPAVLIAAVGQNLVLQPLVSQLGADSLFTPLVVALYIAILFAVAIGALLLATRKLHKRAAGSVLDASGKISWRDVAFGFFAYLGLMAGVAYVYDPAGFVQAAQDKGATTLAITAIPLAIAFLIQGGGEEVVMRGYLPQVFQRLFRNRWAAMLVPSVIFAALHLGYGWPHALGSLMFALFAVAVVMQRGGLSEICGAHAANNFLILWLLSDFQAATAGGSAFDLQDFINDLAIFAGFVVLMLARQAWKTNRQGLAKAAAPA